MASLVPSSSPCPVEGIDDFDEVANEVTNEVADEVTDEVADEEVTLGLTSVVIPAGLVFCRTFFVLGNLLSFLYFIRRFWNQTLICRKDKPIA